MIDIIVVLPRLLITFFLSLLFGIDRQRAHKPVAFGTFIFVALGSTALGIVTVSGLFEDPTPLAAGIVTGIGFLGAGALIKGGDRVFGFTTAASIWLLAIFGLTIGIGEFNIGIIMYALVWAVVAIDKYLEKRGIGSYQKRLTITTNRLMQDGDIKNYLRSYTQKYKIISVGVNKKDNEMKLVYLVEGKQDNINKMAQSLLKEIWIKSCSVE